MRREALGLRKTDDIVRLRQKSVLRVIDEARLLHKAVYGKR